MNKTELCRFNKYVFQYSKLTKYIGWNKATLKSNYAET